MILYIFGLYIYMISYIYLVIYDIYHIISLIINLIKVHTLCREEKKLCARRATSFILVIYIMYIYTTVLYQSLIPISEYDNESIYDIDIICTFLAFISQFCIVIIKFDYCFTNYFSIIHSFKCFMYIINMKTM